jgi:hypothetical protein
MEARDKTKPATTTACSKRQIKNTSKDVASIQPNELMQNMTNDQRTIGLRP